MRNNFNKVMLLGNLTADPKPVTTKTGRAMVTFSVAVDNDWKNREGQVIAETDFHKVVAFGKLGEIIGTYLKKGNPILLSGRLRNRSYETNEGTKRYTTEVVLDDFNFLSRGKKDTAMPSLSGATFEKSQEVAK